jgi:hypothetical protein
MKKQKVPIIMSRVIQLQTDASGYMDHAGVYRITGTSKFDEIANSFGRYKVNSGSLKLLPVDPQQAGIAAIDVLSTDDGYFDWVGSQTFVPEDLINEGARMVPYSRGSHFNFEMKTGWLDLDDDEVAHEKGPSSNIRIRGRYIGSDKPVSTIIWFAILNWHITAEMRDYS